MTPAQQAYALLWRSPVHDEYLRRARAILLESLSRDEQRAAIEWVIAEHGEMATNELIAADIRAGVFPQRSI